MNTGPVQPTDGEAGDASAGLQFPSAIQPHGYLLCLHPQTLRIVQVSENLAALIHAPARTLLGEPVERVIGARGRGWLNYALESGRIDGMPIFAGALQRDDGCAAGLGLSAHRHDGVLIVELETDPAGPGGLQSFGPAVVRTFTAGVAQTGSIGELAELAVREVRQMTGFGRVVLCRFDEQDRGRVIAEARDSTYSSYLDQHFPALDIPPQARELYRRNPVRRIPDADYRPVPLTPLLNPLTSRPTDLTFAALRSVAPIHLDYMHNMGTLATMSGSIIVRGVLWGMVVCHHCEPYKVPVELRVAFERLVQILSLQIESLEKHSGAVVRLDMRDTVVRILTVLAGGGDLVDALLAAAGDLLKIGAAQGMAIVSGTNIRLLGETPPAAAVAELAEWLESRRAAGASPLFSTDQLAVLYPPASAYPACASGMAAVPSAPRRDHYLMWFRPETVRTVEWAGRVSQTPTDAPQVRANFDPWLEVVRGCSLSWCPIVLETLAQLSDALVSVGTAGRAIRAQESGALTSGAAAIPPT